MLRFLFWVALVTATFAQVDTPRRNTRPEHLTNRSPDSRTPRSAEERLWCAEIESAAAQSATLEPAMRSFLLDAATPSLKKCAPTRVRTTLIDSFTATLGIADDDEAKARLQTSSLRHLLPIDAAKVELLLPQALPAVRGALLEEMIADATTAQGLDRALNLLNRIPLGETFPYNAATSLMLALPPEREPDKQLIFQRAMASDHEQNSMTVGGDDFASMVVRFWQHVSPAMALDAIHQVLDEAKLDSSQVSLDSGSDRVTFANAYDYRVFELLPILRQLDGSEADRVTKESQQVQTQLQQFPKGMQSLDPTIRDTPLKKGEEAKRSGGMMGMQGTLGPMLQRERTAESYNARISELGRLAEGDPKQAISSAMTLPNTVGSLIPRPQALLAIARIAAKNHPAAARDALEEMLQSLKAVDLSRSEKVSAQGSYWTDGIGIATDMGDGDLAKKILGDGVEFAEKVEKEDGSDDDPNRALKAWWPSTVVMSRLLLAALDISPETALHTMNEISDPVLKLVCQVTVASKGLGVPSGISMVMVKKKSSNWGQYGVLR